MALPNGTSDPAPDRAGEAAFLERVLRAEADALAALPDRACPRAVDAVDLLARTADEGGAVLVTGFGKSGLIGQKISATLASLGVPSHPIHPAEAAHGDLGRIQPRDCLLALSNSGETHEVVALASILRQDGVPIVAITSGEPGSALERLATVPLYIGPIREADDGILAPTCSTTAALALGDALALAAARRRAFTPEDFARRHPGGSLGGLARPVVEVLRFTVGKNLPVVAMGETVRSALSRADAAGRRPGALVVADDRGALAGIFTDGDLRRLVLRDPAGLDQPLGEVMTRSPRALRDDALVRDAVNLARELRADELPVVDAQDRPVGLLDVQDLLAMRVVTREADEPSG